MTVKTDIVQGDCLDELRRYPNDFFDLIVTSPPYADRRQHTYGGVKPEQYVDWFVPRAAEFLRVLKPTGSFVLNIKEKAENGERHTYVLELILALRKQGWLWTEEYIWHKRNCYPGKWPNRFRDAWERCLHFNKSRKFKMNQESVMVPMGDWADARLKSLGKNDVVRFDSQVGSGFGKNIANWAERTMAFPTNVLHLATECGNKNHSAAFPRALPEWFIKLFSDEGDWVLDPFAGSGTTLEIAKSLGRNAVGIDILSEYCEMARETVLDNQYQLLEERARYAVANEETPDRIHRKKRSKLPQETTGKSRRVKA
ncbi:MAG: DNA-methyltransferase [Rhodocyclaceae bacterium]